MNIKHEVENLITEFDGLKERVEALEKAHYRLEPVPPVTNSTPPPVPSEKDYGWFWPKDQRPEARACFERLLNHSRHCVKHHTISAKERDACKHWLMEWYGISHDNLNTQYATMRAFIERLLPTLAVEEEPS